MYNPVKITMLFCLASILGRELVVFGQGSVRFSLATGDNGILETSLELTCQYTYKNNEVTRSAKLSRKRPTEQSFSNIGSVIIQENAINEILDADLISRSELTSNRTTITLVVNTIKCNDQAEYNCSFFLSNQTHDWTVDSATRESLEVKARPKIPQISFTPSEVIENEAVELFCQGNVGRPAGTLAMFIVTNGVETNLNAQVGTVEVEANGCTYELSAKAYHNFTAADSGRTILRCRAKQQFANTNLHFNQTQPFEVRYAPRETKMFHSVDNGGKVEISPGSVVEVPVDSDVVLRCQTDSNPPALYVWSYVLEGSNDSMTDSPTSTGIFHLLPVRLEQAGLYTCTVNNKIRNVTFTDKVAMRLNVSNIPTSAPTVLTTDETGSTDSNPFTTKSGETKEETGQGALIGGIVGGVIAVIIIVIIVVIVMRRRNNNKQPHDNMSNKPKNNQDPKTVVVHPQLVSPQKHDSYDKYNKAFEKNEKDLYYADLKFDDTPRSRKPVQILAEQINYAEVAWPRV